VGAVAGRNMDILVENMGRINYGPGMYDHKGLLAKPPVEAEWTAHCLSMNTTAVQRLPFSPDPPKAAIGNAWSSPGGCVDIQGSYQDDWNHEFAVFQFGCIVRFTYAGEEKSGVVSGSTVDVDGWASATVLHNGDVKFEDGGYWLKFTHCERIQGNYIDNWNVELSVVQTGCIAQFTYQASWKSGVVNGTRLYVDGWSPATVQGDGTVRFSDGGRWSKTGTGLPIFKRGNLHVNGSPKDTYFDTAGLSKGLIWVNGYNLGRYWTTQGPQFTLYLPAPFLHSGDNEVIVLDLGGSASTKIISVASRRYSTPE